jgi:hypothetical protein
MSPFTFKVIFSFSRLPANQMFQLWTFYPDGEAIAGTVLVQIIKEMQ